MVRKHSNLLGQTNVDEDDASDIEMDVLFWHDVLDLYFLRSTESRRHEDDDLIFFVRKMRLDGYGFNDDKEGNASYFVRRWASELTLFSGFVSYQMVREAYDAGHSRLGSLLSGGNLTGKTDKLYMKGPGGRGEVEVAVSGIADQSQMVFYPPSPVQISKRGFSIGLGTIVRKAASVASIAAKLATGSSDEIVPLKCCLMSISLPWENIAHDLLFKGSPSVEM